MEKVIVEVGIKRSFMISDIIKSQIPLYREKGRTVKKKMTEVNLQSSSCFNISFNETINLRSFKLRGTFIQWDNQIPDIFHVLLKIGIFCAKLCSTEKKLGILDMVLIGYLFNEPKIMLKEVWPIYW